MAGLIPQHFIDELLNRIDIVDVIDAHVPLKKAGKNHQACCPFHSEKTPSFTVSQQKQFYHCFGCGAHGTAISFLMEYLHMGFIEAIEDLASRAGMEVPRDAHDTGRTSQTSGLYELMELVTDFYSKQLRQHPKADNTIVSYLKGRGITGETAKEFELGFAPPGWDNLLTELGKSQEAQQRLEKIGTVIKNERGGYYDRFRDRLMFPIRDQRGRAIGLGGRVLGDDEPKYLNSPETPIFHKGRELYGLYQARKTLKDSDCLYIVEGYMDVIALAQFGIRNAVASLGTAATAEHIEKLFRLTNKLVFCFDGDNAGRTAAWRAMENALPLLREGKHVYFMFLPEGEDPDSFVRDNGAESFKDKKLHTSLSDFLLISLSKDSDPETAEGRADIVNKALHHIARLPPGAYRDILIQELSKQTQYQLADIKQHLSELSRPISQKPSFKTKPRQHKGLTKVSWFVRSLLHQPSLANQISTESLSQFSSSDVAFLRELIEFIQGNSNEIKLANILEHWRDTKYSRRLNELAADEEALQEMAITDEVFTDAYNKLIKDRKKEFEVFKAKDSPSQLTDEEKERFRNRQQNKQN